MRPLFFFLLPVVFFSASAVSRIRLTTAWSFLSTYIKHFWKSLIILWSAFCNRYWDKLRFRKVFALDVLRLRVVYLEKRKWMRDYPWCVAHGLGYHVILTVFELFSVREWRVLGGFTVSCTRFPPLLLAKQTIISLWLVAVVVLQGLNS